ncbi:hypothetical protein Aduo_015817 [Ancylostoma duodenale]
MLTYILSFSYTSANVELLNSFPRRSTKALVALPFPLVTLATHSLMLHIGTASTIRNRTMPVVVDFDQVIAEPQRILGTGWAVPCDVVGLTSKKAKLVKVRFHPSIGELVHSDQQVATAAVKDALKYLDALLDHSEWTRHATKSVDTRIGHLERIAHFLRMRQPMLSFTSRSLDIMWSLHSESHTCNGKLDKCLADALCSLHNHSVATAMVARVQQMSGESTDGGQQVEVLFEKNELVWSILRLLLWEDSDYLQTGIIRDCWQESPIFTASDVCIGKMSPVRCVGCRVRMF